MNNDKVFFCHVDVTSTKFGKPGKATIAYMVEPTSDESVVNLTYAMSYCSPKDQFVKKTGRVRSAGRLNSKNFRHTESLRIKNVGKTNREIYNYLRLLADIERPSGWK